jgi:hypothetical protein
MATSSSISFISEQSIINSHVYSVNYIVQLHRNRLSLYIETHMLTNGTWPNVNAARMPFANGDEHLQFRLAP